MIVEKYLTTKQIKGFLYKYIPKNKEEKKGLFLLPLQTGSGKTHATVQYMSERINDDFEGTIVYAVNTRSNVKETYNKLLAYLDEKHHNEVLLLKKDYDAILDAFTKNNSKIKKLKYLPELEEFKELKNSIEIVLEQKNLKYNDTVEKTITMYNNLLKNKLKIIYKGITNKKNKKDKDIAKLRNIYKQRKNSHSNTKDSAENFLQDFTQEVSLFYPTVLLNEFKIIFMTTHKLFYPIYRLEGSRPFYAIDDFMSSVVFIDEFDAQKKQILNLIIENNVNSTYEFFDLFLRINDTLKNKKFSKKYNIDKDILEGIIKSFDETFKKHNMEYGFKYELKPESDNATVLMDSTLSNIINSQEHTSKIKTSFNEEINHIGSDGDKSFSELLRDVHNALKSFIGLSRSLARKEVQTVRLKNRDSIIDIETEHDALDRFTNDFIKELGYRSSDEHYKYLSEMIKYNVFEKQKVFKSNRDELYEDGFKIINITQMYPSSKTNNFEFFQLNNTPEKFMKDLCNHSFVVGISATATIPTLMANFDLNYLKSKVDYKTLDSKEITKMEKLYIKTKEQKDRKIHVEYVKVDNDITNMQKKYFGEDANLAFSDYLDGLKKKIGEYHFKQYMRLVHVYREFLIHSDIESLIYLQGNFFKHENDIAQLLFEMMISNKSIFSDDIQTKIEKLEQLKENLKSEKDFVQKIIDENILFYRYDSSEKNKEKYTNLLNKKLEAGEKIFIISTYPTMGSGANMEYESYEDSELKDIDAIFMDLPTGFTTRDFKGKKDQIKALFELESLTNEGYFTSSEYYNLAKKILISTNRMKYRQTTDYYNSIMSVIIQAVGRLYRTDKDTSKMFLFLNDHIGESAVNFDSTDQSLLPAVRKLIEVAKIRYARFDMTDEDIRKTINRFNAKNEKLHKKILYMLQVFNSNNIDVYTVEEWEKYRKILISNPTVNSEYIKHDILYEKLPDKFKDNNFYYYTQEEDYKKIEISFTDSNNKLEVSEKTAMLDVIKKTKELAECVKEHNICLEFKHAYMMTPIAFNNLYKGAMGEVLGKFLIEKFCGLKLASFDINNGDEYERFDYKTDDESVYFDFKYYSQSTLERTTQKSLTDKANQKLSGMNAKKAVIVNIFAQIPDNKSRACSIDNNVVVVPFLIDITDRDKPTLEYNMFKTIKRICHEHKNAYQ